MNANDSIRLTAIPLAGFKAGVGGKVVALFTREMGQIRAFARRSGKKSKTLALSPFSTYRVMLQPGKEERGSKALPQLREYQPETVRAGLGEGKNLEAWATASVLAELLVETTETGDPHPYLFEMLQSALDCLEEGAPNADLAIAFLLKFLEHTGYKPRLERAGTGKKRFTFDVAVGGILGDQEIERDEALAPTPGTRFSISAEELLKLDRLRVARFSALKETCLSEDESKRLLELFTAYVEYHFEVRLKSFSVWREMHRV